jgi:cobyrinic acid a,c-diamide synthase
MSWGPAISSAAVEHARQQWEEGHRRLESRARERPVYERLHAQVDSLLDELRKRVGQTFTLEQLATVYADAERWSRDAALAGAPETARPEDVATVEDAAFHLYARGAVDYVP